MPALPTGTIALWFGSVATIPAGFILCDGGGGSPDLRDRFVRGANGGKPPGATGGSVSHTHTFTGDGHDHLLLAGTNVKLGAVFNDRTNSSPGVGETDSADNYPPYHALCFIMKT